MDTFIFGVLLVMLGCTLDVAYGNACPARGCTCTSSGDIMCGGGGLRGIPDFTYKSNELRQEFRELQLGRNNIREIPAGSFDNVKVKYLALWHNPIGNNLVPQSFRGLDDNLLTVDMWQCEIERLPVGLFRDLRKLRMIELGNNKISQLVDGMFDGADNVWSIGLKNNKIQQIARDVFRGMSKLAEVKLENNEISGIASGAFEGMGELRRLHLQNNRLTTLIPDMIRGLSNLKELFLQKNPLQTVADGAFAPAANLKVLSMSSTGIGEIRSTMFSGLAKLRHLSLASNNLTHIPNGLYKMLNVSLKQIDLEHNQLTNAGYECDVMRVGYEGFVMNVEHNPINCNCFMQWVREMSHYGGQIDGSCDQPLESRGSEIGRPGMFDDCPTPMCMM